MPDGSPIAVVPRKTKRKRRRRVLVLSQTDLFDVVPAPLAHVMEVADRAVAEPAPEASPAARELFEAAMAGRSSAYRDPQGHKAPPVLSEAARVAYVTARFRALASRRVRVRPDLESLGGYSNRSARKRAAH